MKGRGGVGGAFEGEEEGGRNGDAGAEVLVDEGLVLQLLPLVGRERITTATITVAVSQDTTLTIVHPRP